MAYVEALAYAAGYAVIPNHVDHFGVDLEIKDRAVRIDVQMKCTEKSSLGKDHVTYDLDVRTYELLSDPCRIVAAYLFVVEVPEQPSDWVADHPEGISLLKCGYYKEMTGLAPTDNRATKAVRLSKSNRLSVASLEQIMKSARGVR